MRHVMWLLGLCLVGVIMSAVPAAGASSASLRLSVTRVPQGRVVTISGRCERNTNGEVISRAFLHDASHDFAGVGAVAFTTGKSGRFSAVARIPIRRAVGTYAVTARCGGGTLGISRNLTVVAVALPSTGSPPTLPITAVGLLLLTAGVALLALEQRTAPQLR
jgi:hypothetical protein